jgi:hypothetical protein
MRKEVKMGKGSAVMDVCRLCQIGTGVTNYPDGVVFVHTERELKDGYCRDCWELVHRRANPNGEGARASSGVSLSKPRSR